MFLQNGLREQFQFFKAQTIQTLLFQQDKTDLQYAYELNVIYQQKAHLG